MSRVVFDAGEKPGVRHLEPAPDQSGFNTLCGWCDVRSESSDEPVNCPICIGIVRYCRTGVQLRRRSGRFFLRAKA